MIGRFPRVLHWEGTFLHGCYSYCYFFPVVNRLPLSSSLMESSYRSSTEEWIHMARLNIWLDLICWSAWEPLSHFPSDPEEHHVANGDATSLTAIHCSGSSPEKHSNHGWPPEISYCGHLTAAIEANLKSSSFVLWHIITWVIPMSNELVCWSIWRLRSSNQTESLELMCLIFRSVRWQAILRICH